jgi:hypothetical protein
MVLVVMALFMQIGTDSLDWDTLQAVEDPGNESGLTISNNLFSSSANLTIQFNVNGSYAPYASFHAAVRDTNSVVNQGPLFLNPINSNLGLSTTSPAIGAGMNLGSSYQNALLSSSIWPTSVIISPQASVWTVGAFISTLP